MTINVPHFINGQPLTGGEKKLEIYHPASGEKHTHVSVANAEIVEKAIVSAASQFVSWSKTTPSFRAKILFKYKALLDQHIKELAEIVTNEHGKTLIEAAGSIQRGIDVVEYACGITNHLSGRFSQQVSSGVDCYSLRQPLGVCVGITPFNFPAMIPLWMFPLAIACGNTFVLKPSEKDPSCALRMIELLKEAGVPDGVVNIVHGDKETVDALITHSEVKAVSFVGSSTVAEYVYKTAISHNKRAQAFGGAKNHCLVMPDADLSMAADAIVTSAYGSAGERCMALSVVVVIEEIAEKLLAYIKPLVQKIKIGPGDQSGVDLCPLVTPAHWERVQAFIQKGKEEKAQLLIDGSQQKPKDHENGFFMGPSLFDHVTPEMSIYQEEIFGPVLCIVRSPNFESAVQLINSHAYGNGTAIFTRDGYYARAFAENVQAGMVGINVPVPVPVPHHSFGGWKKSIFADIGMYGDEAIRFYTKLKTVTQRWPSGK